MSAEEQAAIPDTAPPIVSEQKVKDSSRQKPKKLDVQIPYVGSPGAIKTALDRIRQASTPERVSVDFVNTILKMKGGSGNVIAPFLKKIGLVESDGRPTNLYKRFRNQSTGGSAIASAIRVGYKALGDANEYFYKLEDKGLLALIVEVTGAEPTSSSVKQIMGSIKILKEYADFDSPIGETEQEEIIHTPNGSINQPPDGSTPKDRVMGLNLAYTININLPASTDQAVFNAIFKSLKEHLLSYAE